MEHFSTKTVAGGTIEQFETGGLRPIREDFAVCGVDGKGCVHLGGGDLSVYNLVLHILAGAQTVLELGDGLVPREVHVRPAQAKERCRRRV